VRGERRRDKMNKNVEWIFVSKSCMKCEIIDFRAALDHNSSPFRSPLVSLVSLVLL
jgi:hypothetical protein